MLGLPARHAFALVIGFLAAALPSVAQERFVAYDRITVWRVYPITQTFDLDGTENHSLEFGATGYPSSRGPVTLSNRHAGRRTTYDFPDIQANLRESSSRQYFLGWKRKGKYLGNHITFLFSGFDMEDWHRNGQGIGWQFGVNKTLILGPVAATIYAGFEINHEAGDQYYRRYTADTNGFLTDSVWFQFGLSNRHYKAGATALIRDRFGSIQPLIAFNYSLAQDEEFPSLYDSFPYPTLGVGIGLRHAGWRGLAGVLTYFPTWVGDPLFGTKVLHRLEGKVGW